MFPSLSTKLRNTEEKLEMTARQQVPSQVFTRWGVLAGATM